MPVTSTPMKLLDYTLPSPAENFGLRQAAGCHVQSDR